MRLVRSSSAPPRQGVILLVVVLMLALFLVVGLAFVLYSESAATGSRINKEAQTPDVADVPPETLLSWALGQVIYGATDDVSGAESAMRGHSFARTMYGWHPAYTTNPLVPDPNHTNNPWDATPDPTSAGGKVAFGNYSNTTPFNGLGPLRTIPLPRALTASGMLEYNLVNYTYFATDGFVRDPERPAATANVYRTSPAQNLLPFAGGFNAPYTYPDRTNMFLAAVQSTDPITHLPLNPPRLIAQSFFRPTGALSYAQIDPTTSAGQSFWTTNPNAAAAAWKYMVLRPRPADMYYAPGDPRSFPMPADAGGDVKQLPGVPFYYTNANNQLVPAQNDSFWMDLGYPIQISRNGKKFKPLFAFLVLDLDGRINLNTAGNTNAIVTNNGTQSPAHASNQAVGRHEINLAAVLTAPSITSAKTPEWPQLFTGAVSTTFYAGRYGQDKTPGSASLGANNAIADPYAPDSTNGEMLRSLIFPLDFDAIDMANNRAVTTKFSLPLSPNAQGQPSFASFPQYSATGYDNYTATQAALNPRVNHPLLDQKLRAYGDDQSFGDDNMYWLLANDYRKSYLYNLIPNNLGGPSTASTVLGNQVRQLITTRSYDLDAPGAQPWVTSSAASQYVLNGTQSIVNSTQGNYPTGQPMVTPTPAQIGTVGTQAAASSDYSDFKPNDGRANLLSRVDLNRKLTPYYDASGMFNGGKPIPAPVPASSLIPGLLSIHPEYRYYVATNDRQQMAQDIFNRLVQATGAAAAGRIQAGTASAGEYAAARWLAQLAVNIVDYVDDDDIMTPFQWTAKPMAPDTGWVFGVEAPNLVVNEAYSEVANDPTDTTAATSGAKLPYQYNFWLELYNPMSVPNPPTALSTSNLTPAERRDPNKYPQGANKFPQDRLSVQLQRQSTTTGSTYPVYQIQIVNEGPGPNSSPPAAPGGLTSPGNTDGSVGMTQAVMIDVSSYLPDLGAQATAPANSPMPYPDYTFVQPNIGNFNIPTAAGAGATPNNTGFYLMGPDSKHPFAQAQPNPGGQGGVTLRPTNNLQDQGQTPQQSTQAPWGQPTGATAKNALTYAYSQGPSTTPQSTEAARTHTVMLRRLACPNLDPNPYMVDRNGMPVKNPTTGAPVVVNQNMPYNPYVTVDYMSGVPTNDAVQYISQKPLIPNVPNNPDPAAKNPAMHYSIGRVQPYNAAVTKKQQSSNPNPVQNTFFSHNSQTPPPGPMSASTSTQAQVTLDFPFDWLTFADRPLANVMEVLNVPTTYPHMLTHAFGYNPTTKQRDLANHLAPWGIQDARIYRALEYFTVGDRSPYPGTLGRVAGKININTIFDPPTVAALADPQTNSNWFTSQAVLDVWQGNGNLADSNNNSFVNRKQTILAVNGVRQPDKPFMSLAAPVVPSTNDPQYPMAMGIANTIAPFPITVNNNTLPGGTFTPQTTNTTQVSANPPPSIIYPSPPSATPPTTPPQLPPYIINELLTKVSGHTTVRSNTFAVFLTVGFFEVVNDQTLPVQLGAELTTAGGKNLRHQMFSIVDRTNLAIDAGTALDPGINDPSGRLRQAPVSPTFLPLTDGIAAGIGAPTAKGKPATPVTVGVVGGLLPNITPTPVGLPIDYDGNAPVTFKSYQPAPSTPAPTYWPAVSGQAICQWMFLDTGANQEPVQVTLDTTGTKLQLLFPNGAQFSHPPGAMLSTYQPGNPGPQGPINYNSPQYRAVVPYTYVIQ